MAEPVCPEGYDCKFTPIEEKYIGPWYESTAGTWVTVLAIIALACLLAWLVFLWYESREQKRGHRERHELRQHKQMLAEQFSTQMDMAKGDPEMLKIVREQQRSWS